MREDEFVMREKSPKFLESEYFVAHPGNWHLKEGAPDDVILEFEEYIKNENLDEGIFCDK